MVAIALTAVGSGLASAIFLRSLNFVSAWRDAHPWVLWTLPLGGAILATLISGPLQHAQGGMRKILLDLQHPTARSLHWTMAPAVLLGTLLSHLVGASAGREGTAVQMGSSIAAGLSDRLLPSQIGRRSLVIAGIAAGFASVFGTPLAGAVFSLELTQTTAHRALSRWHVPVALAAAFAADFIARSAGATHSRFARPLATHISPDIWPRLALLALAVATTVRVYVALAHGVKRAVSTLSTRLWLQLAAGAGALLVGWQLCGVRFMGLGVATIEQSFVYHSQVVWWWPIAKLVLTAITIGAGFIGGEVTPLFFVGATLGATLGPRLGIDGPLSAGVCMVATFGAAANTPVAMAVMCGELLGWTVFLQALCVCVLAFMLAPEEAIYTPQRPTRLKLSYWLARAWAARQ
jgi:H+/Cl- antiporter ClcA